MFQEMLLLHCQTGTHCFRCRVRPLESVGLYPLSRRVTWSFPENRCLPLRGPPYWAPALWFLLAQLLPQGLASLPPLR